MNNPSSQELITYLLSFATENKQELIVSRMLERTRHITVVLEDIYQPQNASAVLRTADCFGVQDVHVIENTNEYEINPRVVHGAAKWLNLHKYNAVHDNTTDCIQKLKAKGYSIVATSPHANSVSLHQLPLNKPVALMFGTEKLGLSSTALEQADELMYIPMFGFTESLNISVSAAICFQHLTHRLRQTGIDWHLSEEEKHELTLDWARNVLKDPEGLEKRFWEENPPTLV
jgi:tRNA (guanosine-2'-O-)-methyltransferase